MNIELSPFATLPVVTFTNVHGDEPTHCVWIFQTVAEADAAADKLRSLRKIESVFVRDAPFKGAR